MPFTWDDALQFVKNLGDVCKSILMNIYNMVYSATPQDVTVKYIDNTDHVQETTVPNWAKMNAQFETWKGTVQPQLGYKVTASSKTTLDKTDETFDPGVAAAMSGYYGGYTLDIGDFGYLPEGTQFFEIEANASFSGLAVPYYGRAILYVKNASGTVTCGIQQLDSFGGGTSSSAAFAAKGQDGTFEVYFCCYSDSSSFPASSIPDLAAFYGEIRKLSNDYSESYDN